MTAGGGDERARRSRDAGGLARIEARIASIPAALRAAGALAELAPPFDPHRARAIVTTGVGSSAAHARFLAHVLARELGLPARFEPTGALARTPPPGSLRDALVVFSQGLSPNARFAFAHARAFGAVVVATAQGASARGGERAEWLGALVASGAAIVDVDAPDEYGTLARVVGPMLGLVAALRIARSLGRAIGGSASARPALAFDGDEVARRVERADAALDAALASAGLDPADPASARALVDGEVAFVASEGYGECVAHLPTKWLELAQRTPPPVWDGFELAHGGLQLLFAAAARPRAGAPPPFAIHLARGGARGGARRVDEDATLGRALATALAGSGVRSVALAAEASGPSAAFEHEALANALLVRWLRGSALDPADWPGRDRDGALYARSPALARAGSASNDDARPRLAGAPARALRASMPNANARPRAPLAPAPALGRLRWPEVDAAPGGAHRVAVLALGSVEQHGPHLPLDTDIAIARWLAAGVAARIAGAIALPALELGAASEHAAFPGTLSLSPATFTAVVADLLRSLAPHGFARAFVFSAHGGNLGALRAARDALRAAAAPCALVVCDDPDGVAARLARVGAESGIAPREQGHHAGEVETSILRAIDGHGVATHALAAGVDGGPGDAQALFYPSLRAHAPDGTVGDPRRFDAARGRAYLDAWIDELVAFYDACAADDA